METLETRLALAAEIDVRYLLTSIPDGWATPTSGNGTDFGAVAVAANISRSFQIYNTGNSALSLTGSPRVVIGGANPGDFVVTTMPAGTVNAPSPPFPALTTFAIRFTPSGPGFRAATVSIANNDSDENPYDFAIQGFGGLAPDISVGTDSLFPIEILNGDASPDAVDGTDFGGAPLAGGVVVHTFKILNTSGAAALNLNGAPDLVTISGPDAGDFTVTTVPTSPVAKASSSFSPGSTTFAITFDPSAPGDRTATVTIPSDDPDESPYTFAIQGIGGSPDIDVRVGSTSIPDGSTSSLPGSPTDFGVADLSGDAWVKTFTIHNTGDGFLNLADPPAVTISPYELVPGLVVAPGADDFHVTMLPDLSTVGPDEGYVTFQITYDPSPLAIGAPPINVHPLNPDPNSPDYNSDALTSTDTLRYAKVNISSNDSNESPYDFVISGIAVVGTLRATLVGGVLTIEDAHPTGRSNGFVLSEVGGDLIVTDATSLETFSPDSATNTGGTLSLANKVLTIPKAGITSIVVRGAEGDDTFNVGLLTLVRNLTLDGGAGNDTFGSSLVGLSPLLLTRTTVVGGPNGGTGDKVYVDLSSAINVLGPVVLGTSPTTGTTTASVLPYRPLDLTQVESVVLRDNNQSVDYVLGDLYVRGIDGLGDRLEIRPSAAPDVAILKTGPFSSAQFAVPGKAIFYGRGGSDSLISTYAGHSAEFYGEAGSDTLVGSTAADKLVGGTGSDDISAGDGDNVVWGDHDPVSAGLADTLQNREALADNAPGAVVAGLTDPPHPANLSYADKIRTGNGHDVIYCGPGDDGTSRVMIQAGGGNDYVSGGFGNDRLDLGAGDDRGYGGAGNDYVYGRDGADFLAGNDGDDYLDGGNHGDVLAGGLGKDTLKGQKGKDRAYQGNLTVVVNAATLPLLSPVVAVPYTGTDRSLRKGDAHDQAMAELMADWLDGALGAGLTLTSDLPVVVG